MDEIHSALQKLPDAETHKALFTLEAVRRELKARGGDTFLNSRLLLSSMQRRLASTRNSPTEELAVGILNVLTDFVGCMEPDLLGGVPAVFSEVVPLLSKENVRRAATTFIGGLLKRTPQKAQELCFPLVARGLRADSVSATRLPLNSLPNRQLPSLTLSFITTRSLFFFVQTTHLHSGAT